MNVEVIAGPDLVGAGRRTIGIGLSGFYGIQVGDFLEGGGTGSNGQQQSCCQDDPAELKSLFENLHGEPFCRGKNNH